MTDQPPISQNKPDPRPRQGGSDDLAQEASRDTTPASAGLAGGGGDEGVAQTAGGIGGTHAGAGGAAEIAADDAGASAFAETAGKRMEQSFGGSGEPMDDPLDTRTGAGPEVTADDKTSL